jgi:iron complex outermembrane receptor protein
MRVNSRALGLLFLFVLSRQSSAQDSVERAEGEARALPSDLTALSIEELMEIEVTSVSKKEERLSHAAAAVYVITQEDIRRSGLKSIPELLRMVPGLEVARIDANKWAISSRGFNGRFANKLLVLIDGRSVYTPLFSGVFWDVQDTLLQDVERIEVIRGPGAAVWGANAVNGVINIITKKARDTQGGLVVAGGGTEELALGGLRYGGAIGENIHYRIFGKYLNHDDFVDAAGKDAADEWRVLRGGFRLDLDLTPEDLLTVQGDLYGGDAGSRSTVVTLTAPFSSTFDQQVDLFGGNALARWTHLFSPGSDLALQIYYDRAERDDQLVAQKHDTLDIDFQHRFHLGQRQEVLWGAGYRLVTDHLENGPTVTFNPTGRTLDLLSAFVQDEVTLVEKRLRLTLGSKFEHNDFTGFEVQPSGRLLWTPGDRHAVWAAVSRAVRTPSRVEHDARIDFSSSPGTLVSIFGDRSFDSEDLLAFELGYRVRPLDRLSFDIATFYNRYENLFTLEQATPFAEGSPPPPHLVIPLHFANQMDGETYGVEVASNLQVTDWWRLSGSYSFLRMELHPHGPPSPPGASTEVAEGESPRNQAQLRSSLNLPHNLELDLFLYYVDNLPQFGVPGYLRLDARLGWRPFKRLELSIGVQNALDDRHPEFGNEIFTNHTEVQHSIYGMLVWRF